MPIVRRYRYSRGYGRPKWSVFRKQGLHNMLTSRAQQNGWNGMNIPVADANGAIPNNSWRANYSVLVENINSQNTYVPPVMKISHLSVNVAYPPVQNPANAGIIGYRFLLMFIPQGYEIKFLWPAVQNGDQSYEVLGTVNDHPEWILAERSISPQAQNGQTITLSTRGLRRNLNSGDKICLIAIGSYITNQFINQDIPLILNWRYAARTN